MTYHKLSDSGMTDQARRDEARRIVEILLDYLPKMTDKERKFVEKSGDAFTPVSTAQLFWLRDIKDKYL